METIFLYGPPGAGKSTVGRRLADGLQMPFVDLDEVIVARAGCAIPQIFAEEGEAGFRARELAALREVSRHVPEGKAGQVVALGGGALLAPAAREAAEAGGVVVCLQAQPEALLTRLQKDGDTRPLLQGDAEARLRALLEARAAHYQSFARQVDTSELNVEAAVWQTQVQAGRFHVSGMGQAYDIVVRPGGLQDLGRLLALRGLKGPVVVVADEHVAPLYGGQAVALLQAAGYAAGMHIIPAGEAAKTIETIAGMWAKFVEARLERSSTVVALGGGVAGDMTGFAAATFLRGIHWVNVPTTLLAMVDSSLGGKTGIDLPQGKNLVGAFYPPRLVLADPNLLASLPDSELRSGLAETIKHGVIDDPALFERCGQGWQALTAGLDAVARQGMAVKVKVIEIDPYEKGLRQALNLGHTVGHGVELASDFHLSHGQAVAIGMVVEARLAEACGVAEAGLAETIAVRLQEVGLPVRIPPDLDRERILAAMQMDKKRAAGKQRFALPERIGSVRVGVEVDNWQDLIFQ